MKKILIFLLFIITVSFTVVNTSIPETIKEWIGVPYRYGGTTKKGIDCSGLTQQLYKEIYDTKLPRTASQQWKVTERINKDSLQQGDLVFFKSKRSPSGWHVGFYLGEGKFIHSPGRKDKVKISNLEDKYYSKMYKGAGRI